FLAEMCTRRAMFTVTEVEGPHVGTIGSENVRSRLSPCSAFPSMPPLSLREANTGPAASDGGLGGKALAFAQPAKATVKAPTAVSRAPGPSVMVSVAVDPEIDTPERAPPEGTLASVQPVVHDGPMAPEKV